MPAKPIPDGYDSLIPYLIVRDAAKAIEFYQQLFGASEIMRMPYPNSPLLMHAELKIRSSVFMLTDESANFGQLSPLSLNGQPPVSIMVYVPDVDAVFAKASSMGVKAIFPPGDMFWGDRFSKFADPFGHIWCVATHKEDVTPVEMAKRAASAFDPVD